MKQWARVSVTATQKQVSGASHSVQAEARSLYPVTCAGHVWVAVGTASRALCVIARARSVLGITQSSWPGGSPSRQSRAESGKSPPPAVSTWPVSLPLNETARCCDHAQRRAGTVTIIKLWADTLLLWLSALMQGDRERSERSLCILSAYRYAMLWPELPQPG